MRYLISYVAATQTEMLSIFFFSTQAFSEYSGC